MDAKEFHCQLAQPLLRPHVCSPQHPPGFHLIVSRWTLFTSAFAHQDLAHILFNGFTFYFMAPLTLSLLVRLFICRVETIPDLILQTGKQAIPLSVPRRHVLNISPSRASAQLIRPGGAVAQLGSTAYTNIFQNGRDPYSLGASG